MKKLKPGATKTLSPGGATSADGDEVYDMWNVVSRAFIRGSDWPDKDDLLDVLYWFRQCYSALFGLFWGLVPFHGLLAVIIYVVLSTALGHLYVTAFQGVDEDLLGGMWEVAKEGFGSAFATFVVTWIIVYSMMHGY